MWTNYWEEQEGNPLTSRDEKKKRLFLRKFREPHEKCLRKFRTSHKKSSWKVFVNLTKRKPEEKVFETKKNSMEPFVPSRHRVNLV